MFIAFSVLLALPLLPVQKEGIVKSEKAAVNGLFIRCG